MSGREGEANRPIRIDVWADVQCIWCYISAARLRTATQRHLGHVEVVHHSFQLTPNAPVEIDRDAHIRAHGVDPSRMQQIITQLRQLTEQEGLRYDPDNTKPTNSHHALELLHHAGTIGKRTELTELLFTAYFADGRHLGHVDELLDIAEDAGLERESAAAVLTHRHYAVAVDADMQQAQRLGARGVPFYVVNNTYRLSGAQPVEQFLAVFGQGGQG
jgi:predicted DsbA family dithiol-disulfide isomerase